jgi:hypothetical protein
MRLLRVANISGEGIKIIFEKLVCLSLLGEPDLYEHAIQYISQTPKS